METQLKNNKRQFIETALTWGLLYGLFVIAYTTILNVMEFYPVTIKGFFVRNILIAMSGAIFFNVYSLKKYRDTILNGILSYGHALLFGIVMFVAAAIVTSLFDLIWISLIDPSLYEKMANSMMEYYQGFPNISEAQLTELEGKAEEMRTLAQSPFLNFIKSTGSMALLGSILTLIVAAIVKRSEVPFSQEEIK